MRSFFPVIAASLASLAAATASNAAVYGGFVFAPGVLRGTNLVVQGQSDIINATSYLTVVRSTGVLEYPVFVVTAPGVCTAVGPDYTITMAVLSPTQTEVKINATAATCRLRSVQFGTPNSRCAYDLTNPNPGTAGSLNGSNPVPVSLTGAWTATIKFDNAVNIFGAAARMDLFSRMTVNFNVAFDVGDSFGFRVDTDAIN